MTGVLIKRWPCGERHTLGGCHVTTKAKIGVRQPQAKECQRLLANHQTLEIDKEGSFHVSEGARPYQHLEFGFLASRIVRPYISVVLNRLLQSLIIIIRIAVESKV